MLPVSCQTTARSTRPPSRGKPGNEVEAPEQRVHERQVSEEGGHAWVGDDQGDEEATTREHEAGERSHDRDQQLGRGAGGIAGQAGDAPEQEQRDGGGLHTLGPRHQRVGELVHQDRGEEQDRRDRP